MTGHLAHPAGRRPAARPGLVGRCLLLLLLAVSGCDAAPQRPPGLRPAGGADTHGPQPYRRGVWLLLDAGEHRHACRGPGVGHYRYIVVQWYATRDTGCPLERIKAANPRAKVLAYQNIGAMIAGPHTDGRPSTCVTQEEAAAHDAVAPADAWHVHDPTGSVLAFRDPYAYLQPGNVGRVSYQVQCLRRLARIAAEGYDGVLGDDVNVSPGHGLGSVGGTPIAEYPTDAAYGDAIVGALQRIGPEAERLGLPLVANVGADPQTPADRRRALAIARASAGFLREFWTRWDGPGPGQGGATWEAGAALAQEVEALGKPFIASTYQGPGSDDPAAEQQYAVASFWLVWDGRQDSGWGYDVPGDPDAGFSPAWGPDLGPPLDVQRVRVGVGWQRRYTGGLALVNPSPSTSQAFDLGAGYRKPDGAIVATVVVPPMRGMVLTRAGTTAGDGA